MVKHSGASWNTQSRKHTSWHAEAQTHAPACARCLRRSKRAMGCTRKPPQRNGVHQKTTPKGKILASTKDENAPPAEPSRYSLQCAQQSKDGDGLTQLGNTAWQQQ
eukprot:1142186-Pelagomonas_calceolata.AAC.2